MSTSVFQRIESFNAGRDPQRLAMKYRNLAGQPFAFLRGTCHLFYQDLAANPLPLPSPASWLCGDLHLENFGSYKGDNRLVYFDINDFDEAILAPAHWDVLRFLVSVLIAGHSLQVAAKDAEALCGSFLDAYIAALALGSARWVERATASGMVRDLLRGLRKRQRSSLLDSRSELRAGKRQLRLDGRKALKADAADQEKVRRLLADYAARQPHPEFFKPLDIARRIAGTGSLGLERYVILVRGRGGIDGNFLLDLKYQPGSALAPYTPLPQPAWRNEAARVIAVQQRLQAIPPAFLSEITDGNRAYTLKELLPSQDRVALEQWKGKFKRLDGVVRSMGRITAWAQLRASGRQGAASADELIAFAGNAPAWRTTLLDAARSYAGQVERDWQAFCEEYAASPWALRKFG